MTVTPTLPHLTPPAPTRFAGPVSTAPIAPADLGDIAQQVEVRLDAFLAAERDQWAEFDPTLAEPVATLQRLVMTGGKRLRPAFCHWGFVAAGGDPGSVDGDEVLVVAQALELLHAFALVHDDVMDGADRRRGEPTAHVEHGARHRAAGWRGEERRFGESVAILVGDLAHVLADRLMDGRDVGVVRVWRELQTELMMGQYLDVVGTARSDRSDSRARLVMQLKSGRYTIERPLELGATLGGADRDDARNHALARYGRPLGEAFQLRDDLLGTFGSTAATGKPVGDDLREGKPTRLLAHASAHADRRQRAQLDRVGAPDLTDDEIAALQAVMIATGTRAVMERSVDRLTSEAVAALDTPVLTQPARHALYELAWFLAGRQH